jgi:hypothetical protein
VRARTEPLAGDRAAGATYGAPDGAQHRPTPTPVAGFPAATPRGTSYADVHIRGDARFVRSNDHYGTAEVVYESEFDHKQLGGATPSPRTPSSLSPRGTEKDILGSLRSTARKGTPAPTVLQRTGRKKGVNIPIILAFCFVAVLLLGAIGLGAFNMGLLDQVFNTGVVEEPTKEFYTPVKPPPADSTDGSSTSDETTDGSTTADDGSAGATTDTLGDGADATPDGGDTTTDGAASTAAKTETRTSTKAETKPKTETKPTTTAGTSTKPKTETTTSAGTSTKPKTETKTETKTAAGTATDPKAGTTAGTDGAADTTPETPVEPPVVDPPDRFDGSFRGSVGNIACLADLTQKGEDVVGTITVAGQPFRVSGRYNEARGSLSLRGTQDENIYFRGDVQGSTVKGTARMGAGQIPQAFQLMK